MSVLVSKSRQASSIQRKEAFLELAVGMFAELDSWYDGHPDATFGEIEARARELRRRMMGEALGIIVNGRDHERGMMPEKCAECGKPMERDRPRPRTVRGLEGDTVLYRAYYVCPDCTGQTVFPPRP